MRNFYLFLLAGVVALTACDSARRPSDGNFRKAIDQYLAKRGKVCTWIGRPFPVDVSESEQKLQSGTGPQMAVLEVAGLVRSSDTITATPGIFGPGAPRRVKRYEPTEAGMKYLQQVPAVLGESAGFCYGDKTVDSIVKWSEPVATGPYSQSEVTYTYKIADLAPWAQRPDIQREFGDVRTTVNGVSKSNEVVDLQLTNQGWKVPVNETDSDATSHPTSGFIGRANLRNASPAILIRHMRNQVDGPPAFLRDILQRDAARATRGKLREAPQRISGAVGVDRRERTAMAGVEGVEKDTRLRTTNLPYNNPVRPMA